MSKYKAFATWYSDDGTQVDDWLVGTDNIPHIEVDGGLVWLTPTDIKRLAECVERWEADERSESIGRQAEV